MVSKFRGTDNFDTSFATAIAIVADVKPPGTNGGANVAGNQTRDLNTELTDEQGIVMVNASTGEFTLSAGKYFIKWSAPVYRVNRNRCNLHNSSGLVSLGSSEYSNNTSTSTTVRSHGGAIVSIDEPTDFFLEQFTETAGGSAGLGVESNSGNNEVYAMVEIHKIGL